jgi:hypothetical protein
MTITGEPEARGQSTGEVADHQEWQPLSYTGAVSLDGADGNSDVCARSERIRRSSRPLTSCSRRARFSVEDAGVESSRLSGGEVTTVLAIGTVSRGGCVGALYVDGGVVGL